MCGFKRIHLRDIRLLSFPALLIILMQKDNSQARELSLLPYKRLFPLSFLDMGSSVAVHRPGILLVVSPITVLSPEGPSFNAFIGDAVPFFRPFKYGD